MMELRQLSRDDLNVRWLNPNSDSASPISEIVLSGTPTGRTVSGAVLEAAVAADQNYVVFMTDDTPFEDVLTIEYLNENLDLIDRLRIGWIYSTGTFSDLRLQEPNRLCFGFMGDTVWVLELLAKKEVCLPLLSSPKGVWHRLSFSRRMKLLKKPRPDTKRRA
jgi:hypothetical protein